MEVKIGRVAEQRIRELAANGMNQSEIARAVGLSRSRVSQIGKTLKLVFRRGRPCGSLSVKTKIVSGLIAKMAKEGKTQRQIAKAFRLSSARVCQLAKSQGLTLQRSPSTGPRKIRTRTTSQIGRDGLDLAKI